MSAARYAAASTTIDTSTTIAAHTCLRQLLRLASYQYNLHEGVLAVIERF
jgi:hypothetical protein